MKIRKSIISNIYNDPVTSFPPRNRVVRTTPANQVQLQFLKDLEENVDVRKRTYLKGCVRLNLFRNRNTWSRSS